MAFYKTNKQKTRHTKKQEKVTRKVLIKSFSEMIL